MQPFIICRALLGSLQQLVILGGPKASPGLPQK